MKFPALFCGMDRAGFRKQSKKTIYFFIKRKGENSFMYQAKKRLLAAFLCAVICMGQLASCSNNEAEGDKNPDTSSNNVENPTTDNTNGGAEEETEEKIRPNLPETKYDGYSFRMLGKGDSMLHWQSKDLTAEEMNGEPINDAVYKRNSIVSEQFDVKFVEYDVADYFNQQAEIARSAQSSTDEYDIATLKPEGVVSSFISNGYLMNLYDIPYMDLTKPWYDQNSIKQMSLGGKVYAVMGDMLTMDDDATAAVFFNKKLAAANSLPNLYEMVHNGTWTIDKLTEYAATAANDVNGDGEMDEKTDTWGALSEYASTFALISGCGKTMITKDESDTPANTATDEQYMAMYEKVLKLQNNWDVTLYAESVSGYSDVWTECMDVTFQSDRALFNICWLNRASLFREMETDFGILPMPKYDETQEDYHSFVHMYCANCIIVPKTNSNFERTGVIVEALSAESTDTLKPAYYEKTLKSKGARDEESSAMLDIIFDTRIFDLGYMFNWGGIYSQVGSLAGKEGQDITGYASTMGKINKSLNRAIKQTMEKVAEN